MSCVLVVLLLQLWSICKGNRAYAQKIDTLEQKLETVTAANRQKIEALALINMKLREEKIESDSKVDKALMESGYAKEESGRLKDELAKCRGSAPSSDLKKKG